MRVCLSVALASLPGLVSPPATPPDNLSLMIIMKGLVVAAMLSLMSPYVVNTCLFYVTFFAEFHLCFFYFISFVVMEWMIYQEKKARFSWFSLDIFRFVEVLSWLVVGIKTGDAQG